LFSILSAVVVFGAIIFIHELGHFLLAKANGIGVVEFSLGMGPRLVSVEKGETRYSLKLLPFGGSCMMLGEDANATDPKAFNSKPVWARISVIAAGPFFNFLLAFLLAMVLVARLGYDAPVIAQVREGFPAAQAGLKPGDRIVRINGSSIHFYREIVTQLAMHPQETLRVTVERTAGVADTDGAYAVPAGTGGSGAQGEHPEVGQAASGGSDGGAVAGGDAPDGNLPGDSGAAPDGSGTGGVGGAVSGDGRRERFTVSLTPQYAQDTGSYLIGIVSGGSSTMPGSVFALVQYSFYEIEYWIRTTVQSLGMMFRGQVGADDIAGPVRIVSIIGDTVEEATPYGLGWVMLSLANMMLLLSANLGVMNLLPIPALDGGRLLFLFIEAIRRKPIDKEKEGLVHLAGMVALMILMVVVLFHDIWSLFG
jgi:regulator of sigma E protease